jgi:deoxyadenosine/deoxycytidine kinase
MINKYLDIQEELLAELKKEQKLIALNIVMVKDILNSPPYESHINFRGIEEEAKRNKEFLDKCNEEYLRWYEKWCKGEASDSDSPSNVAIRRLQDDNTSRKS